MRTMKLWKLILTDTKKIAALRASGPVLYFSYGKKFWGKKNFWQNFFLVEFFFGGIFFFLQLAGGSW